MTDIISSRRGWTRGQVLLAFLVLTAAIACGLAIFSSATTLTSLSRTAFSALFMPLLLALVLSFLLQPLVYYVEKLAIGRTVSIFIVYLVVGGGGLVALLWLSPNWESLWTNLGADLPRYAAKFTGYMQEIIGALHDRFPQIESYELASKIQQWTQRVLSATLAHTPGSALKVGGLMILVPLFTFFFLRDGRKILRAAVAMSPNRQFEMIHDLSYLISRQLAQFIRGRILEAFIVGLVIGLGLSLTDIRYAPVLGLFAGVTNLIPYIGPIIGMVPGILIAFVDFGMGGQFWWTVILYVLIAQVLIDNFILIPILISRVSNLHPLLVFFAIIVGGKLYGVVGMIIGVPIVSIIQMTILEVRTYRRTFRLPESALESDRSP
ncbi:MAG: AI-2E family transporter [Desulfuromonadales bacterium]|nr:AI-2E family transporter [Desulfuromonadales bacterium]